MSHQFNSLFISIPKRKCLQSIFSKPSISGRNIPKGNIGLHVYPNKQQEHVSKISCYNLSPVFDQVFEFDNLVWINQANAIIIGVYKHTRCIQWRMVGVIPVHLKSVDLCGRTAQRRILENPNWDMKVYALFDMLIGECNIKYTAKSYDNIPACMHVAVPALLIFK